MNLKKIFLIAFLALSFVPAHAAEQIGIIASVGDEAITTQDLVNRTRLVIISSGLKADEETARKLSTQVLQSLINERLQIQEAQRLGLDISNDEISTAIATIEQQNKMKPDQLINIIKAAKLPLSALQQQVKGQIAWSKIRARRIQPKVNITEAEVEDYLKLQAFNPMQQEYLVNEIVLTVENPKDETKILESANKIAADLNADKNKFKSIAKQFSQAGSSQNGGEVGWLAESQVPKELLAEIKKSGIGKILGPIRSVEGYFILYVAEARDIDAYADMHTVTLRQFELPLLKNTKLADANKKIGSMADSAKACVDSKNYAEVNGVLLEDYGSIQIKDLQGSVKKLVSSLPTGEFSAVVDTGKSLLRFIICEKTEFTSTGIDQSKKDKAKDELFRKKMELESRKYLRELRRSTNIEIKA